MSVIKHVGLFLLPVTITAVGVAWYLELFALETSTAAVENKANQEVELSKASNVSNVSNALSAIKPKFEVLSYPEVTQLAQLSREWPMVESPLDMESFAGETFTNDQLVQDEYEQFALDGQVKKTSPTMESQDDLGLSLDELDLSSLSPDLALKVENALTNSGQTPERQLTKMDDLEQDAQEWHGRLPALNLQTHMYSSDVKRRWVKINNTEYYQGDVVNGQITLKEIQPQAVIVEFQGQQIRIPALYEWKG
ncbi:general secretion pathway protein GspB [Vibrio alfacsensis]|uniref:general secretion pathway protein GspB n=1 Tax=Vibrio alfacsensis TaxID=1074311 RepID=UPI001BED8107|nr:general secretion pathway protein GspB [Vibrio alfacsensis]BBM65716.1 general secretion pathway protein GspB [Vibrio alfacsensis]